MTAEFQPSSARFSNVLVSSGHMIDAPGREQPRFPEAKAEAVRAEIARQLQEWRVGREALAICGGASGGDTIFAEECLRRGAQLRLLLAEEVEDFARVSVAPAGEDWLDRFHALRRRAQVAILSPAIRDGSIYERINHWIIESAQAALAPGGQLFALLVWDEKPAGDGPGGTADFEQRVRALGGTIAIVNPTAL
ncbi:MAG: hypothetical protein M3Y86_12985 [Verrucomicrobiota bacterium]|nr:hypothetical protein [Verrucomicrobiota bacterium]